MGSSETLSAKRSLISFRRHFISREAEQDATTSRTRSQVVLANDVGIIND